MHDDRESSKIQAWFRCMILRCCLPWSICCLSKNRVFTSGFCNWRVTPFLRFYKLIRLSTSCPFLIFSPHVSHFWYQTNGRCLWFRSVRFAAISPRGAGAKLFSSLESKPKLILLLALQLYYAVLLVAHMSMFLHVLAMPRLDHVSA